jgi:glycosyltransferase involved in cell wall biosynthesis
MVAVYQAASQADLVYIQGPVSEGLPGMLGAWLANKKFALKVVGDFAWEQAQVQSNDRRTIGEFQATGDRDDFKTMLWRMVEKWVARSARVVITPSKYLEGIVAGWGVEQVRRRVILNSFHTPQVPDEPIDSIRQRLSLASPTIVSIGRLVPWKGLEQLIEAMPLIREKVSDVRLVIIGDGPELARLKDAVRRLHLEDCVQLAGQLPFSQTFDYLRAVSVLVLNSSYEGLSHVLLEAMAAGVPIVATDVCGNGEVVEHRRSGLLVPWNNQAALVSATVELLLNRDLAQQLTSSYAEVLKKFEPHRMVEETAASLEECV